MRIILIQLQEKLVNKSIEAFLLALEIYNKPTIKYRAEGFSFFICNAWELMLKAELLRRNESIYYKNSADRTISLNNTISKIYTDKHSLIRVNLGFIIKLRDTNTHFVTEDYEATYIKLFQACVINFMNEIKKFHDIDITKYISNNFLILSINYDTLINEEIKAKYTPQIAQKLIDLNNEIDIAAATTKNEKFAINLKQNLYITKKKDEADFCVKIDSAANSKVAKIKELKDPSDTHKHTHDSVVDTVCLRLKQQNISIAYKKGFNKHILSLIIKKYNIKDDKSYSYAHTIVNQQRYTYSEAFIDFIVNLIIQQPDLDIEDLK